MTVRMEEKDPSKAFALEISDIPDFEDAAVPGGAPVHVAHSQIEMVVAVQAGHGVSGRAPVPAHQRLTNERVPGSAPSRRSTSSYRSALRHSRRRTNRRPRVGRRPWSTATAPGCGLGAEAAAFLGLVRPEERATDDKHVEDVRQQVRSFSPLAHPLATIAPGSMATKLDRRYGRDC